MNHKSLVMAIGIAGSLFLPIQNFPFFLSVPRVVAQPVASQLSSSQLQKQAQSITVKILSGDSGGSGILIEKDGQVYTVLTNQHLLTPGKTVRIQTLDGSFHQATPITGVNFQGKDLALLQFRASADYAVASLTNLTTVAVNEQIFAAGFPFDTDSSQPSGFTLTTGQVLYVPERAFKEGYQIGYSNNIEKGMSGGPILNRQGQVIGINGILADPLWGDPYVYEDGSRPTDAQRDLMSRYSWGIPIQTFAQLAPQYASPEALAAGTPTATEENLPPIANNVNNIAQQITVLIRWEKGNGSGVIVGKKGNTYTVLTAEHVVRNKTSFEVVTTDGKNYLVTVDDKTVKNIPGADLAIVQFTSNQNYRVATLANYDLPSDLSNGFFFVYGWAKTEGEAGEPRRLFSAGIGLLVDEQIGFALTQNSSSLNYGYRLFYTNLTKGGMSGGPVLDIRGRVIGIHGRADDVEITDKAGRTRHVPLGDSIGVPISAFVNQFKEVGLEGELRVENFPPPPLTEEEKNVIVKALFNLKEPNTDADAIDWLNYGWKANRAGKKIESGDKKAISAFDRAIQLDPNFSQAWYLRGLVLSINNHESLESFNRAIQIDPKFYQAWRQRGNVLYHLKRYQEALESFDRALEHAPNSINFFDKIPKISSLLALKRYSEALEAANQLIKSYSDARSYAVRGAIRATGYDYQGAIADTTEAIRLDPKNALNFNFRGNVYNAQENYQAAIADFTEALHLKQDSAEAYSGRALARFQSGDTEGALADYTKAIRFKQDFAEAYVGRALVRSQSGDREGALADYTKAIRLKQDFATAYSGRALVHSQSGDREGALADFTEAIRLDPKTAYNHFFRGIIYYNQKNYQVAIADFTDAIRLKQDFAEAYGNRAVARAQSGDTKGAIEDINEALRLKPDLPQAYFAQGLIRAAQEDYQGAIEDYNQVLRTQEIGRVGLRPEINEQTKTLTIAAVSDNSPAYKGGIKVGDQILEIDNKPTVNLSLEEVINLISGQKETQVTLRISRPGTGESKVTLTRELIVDPRLAEVYYNRGLARFQLKDQQGAQDDLQTAADLYKKQNNTEMYQTALKKLKELQ